MADFFNLDFVEPKEITNEKVLSNSLYDRLLQNGFKFSTTANGIGAAYIMKDGKFLFLEQNKELLKTTTKITHGSLDFYLAEKKYIRDTEASRILCQTDNAIRINDGTNFEFEVLIGLPKKSLTDAQYNSLENWLYNLMTHKKYIVNIGNELVSVAFKKYNLREQFPEEITKKIKTYYHNGILREAKDIKGETSGKY